MSDVRPLHSMDALQTIAPLLGVVIGGLLTGVTAYVKTRQARKRVLAVALADLLEVRHRLVSVDLAIRALRDQVPIQADLMPALRNLFDSLLPGEAELDERYNKAVTMLSSIDPVLGFSLRSKNSLPRVLAALRTQAASNGADPALFEAVEASLRTAVTPSLNAAVVELAYAHSFFTGRRVKKMIANSGTLPPEVAQFFETLKPAPLALSTTASSPEA
jgi:hypothetical protein